MGVPPDVWAMQAQHLKVPPPSDSAAVQRLQMVQNSSHTPQGAFGYLLSQIEPKPKLTVATHFPVSDDTVYCAMNSLAQYVDPAWLGDIGEKVTWSFDRMVLRLHVGSGVIEQCRGEVLDFGGSPIVRVNADLLATPKYATADGAGDPLAQIDPAEAYEPGENTYCATGY
jgi:ribonuclease Z